MSKVLLIIVGIGFNIINLAFAQDEMPPPQIKLELSPAKFDEKDTLDLKIDITLPQGWHINSQKPELEYLIPSRLTIWGDGLQFSEVEYPRPKKQYVEIFKQNVSMFIGSFTARASLWKSDAKADLQSISGQLFYQACSHNMCLPPDSIRFFLDPQKQADMHFYNVDDSISLSQSTQGANKFDGPILTVILLLLGGGLLLNLTPCVYPLIAITISIFAAQGNRKIPGRFFAAFLYVFGIVCSFSALGTIASISGQMFGSALQSPIAQIVIAGVFVLLALSSFGVFELQLPSGLMGKAMKASNIGGYTGNLVAGLFAGILASPCIGPFILALLIYVAEQKNVFAGVWMFSTLAFGMGLPYLFLGMAAGLVSKLPKSGGWMVVVKKLLGLVLLGLAAYYLRGFIGEKGYNAFIALLLAFAAVYLQPWKKRNISLPNQLLIISAAIILLVFSGLTSWKIFSVIPHLAWEPYSDKKYEKAVQTGQPVLLDFESKIWCVACREMEEKTYADPKVKEALAGYMLLKIDVDKHPQRMALSARWKVRGIPVAIIIDDSGKEKCRMVGFVSAGNFIEMLNKKPSYTI